MSEKIPLLLFFIYGIKVFTVTSAPVLIGTCEDSGVMIAGGEIDCKYLENPSAYNIHKNPEPFCMKYQKECCVTCTRLRQNGFLTTKSTAVTHTTTNALSPLSVTPASVLVGTCEDSGVMIAGGEIDCKYIENPSAYNIHKNPEPFCMKYQKECCVTCTRLKQNGYYTTKSTAVSHTSTKASNQISVQPTDMCKDTGVWIGDGLVECRYLERPSAYNIHKNPAGSCQKYFNKCCATCTRLKQNGYSTIGTASIVPSVVSHTLSKASIPLPERPTEACKDTGAWVGDGLVECRYLEQPSSYNIHKNPDGFCQKNFNECCVTCSRLKQNGLITLNYVTEKAMESTSTIVKPKSFKTTAYGHLKLPNFVLTIINFAYKVVSG